MSKKLRALIFMSPRLLHKGEKSVAMFCMDASRKVTEFVIPAISSGEKPKNRNRLIQSPSFNPVCNDFDESSAGYLISVPY